MSCNSFSAEANLSANAHVTAEVGAAGEGINTDCCITTDENEAEPASTDGLERLASFAAPATAILNAPAKQRLSRGARIARISDETAVAISSQQVVIDLKSICKELVENALDAGATSIEVRLMDCGLGGVEVRDNGNGISPENLEILGCRHATSKISSFEDIYSKLDSMGFRGEALSSLCFVSRVSIVTRCRSADFGTRIYFDHSGKQVAREATAREVGTTVSVEDIFARMPLRRRTMEQTKQRQLQDALALMQRIALLHATSCRIVFSNFDPNTGGRSTFLATKGTSSGLLEAALTVYGSKQLAACTEIKLSGNQPGREWRLEAVISRPPHGVRSAGLQHFFVKRRAVEFPPLLQKLLNKKWKEVSSRGLFPVCLAFLELDASLLDINVRKDKQQVLLAVERDVAQALLEAVSTTLAPSVGSFEFDSAGKQRQLTLKTYTMSQLSDAPYTQQDAQQLRQEQEEEKSAQERRQCSEQQEQEEVHSPLEKQSSHQQEPDQQQGHEQRGVSAECDDTTVSDKNAVPCSSEHCGLGRGALSFDPAGVGGQTEHDGIKVSLGKSIGGNKTTRLSQDRASEATTSLTALQPRDGLQARRPLGLPRRQRLLPRLSGDVALEESQQSCEEPPLQDHESPTDADLEQSGLEPDRPTQTPPASSGSVQGNMCFLSPTSLPAEKGAEADWIAKEVVAAVVGECCYNLDELYSVKEPEFPGVTQEPPSADAECTSRKPCPAWADAPSDFSLSGERAKLGGQDDANFFLFRKGFFSDLRLVGQFNEGFIIAALRQTRPERSRRALTHNREGVHANSEEDLRISDANSIETISSLFIIDQHASDEKRIFEALNEEFRPRMQPLIAPLKLSLPAELIAAVEAFAPHLSANGFAWIVRDPCTPQRPLQFAQCVLALPESCGSAATATGKTTNASFTFKSQQQRFIRPESVYSAEEDKSSGDDIRTTSGAEQDGETEHERHCFLTGLPVIEGRQLTPSDFLEFLSALASEDQGKAMWNGTMPQPPSSVAEGTAPSQQASPHHRVLQYRPSRVWDILASKACRSAVMIGDPLAPHKQVAILRRMAGLQLPFNCPHGRPTMRHLIDLPDEDLTADERAEGSGKACREVHSHPRDRDAGNWLAHTSPAAIVNTKDHAFETSYRKKRPASPMQHHDDQLRKNHLQNCFDESEHFPVARDTHKEGHLTSHPSSAQTVPGEDDSLLSEDDNLLVQKESQAAGGAVGAMLFTSGDVEGTVKPALGTFTQCGLDGLSLTFIG
ncbi:hypothetical protein Efla_003861 [Eimeria flavescens]